MSNIFYNQSERRLRAFWRILLQGLIFFAVTILVNALLGLVLGLMAAAKGQIPDQQTIMELYSLPFVRVINGIGEVAAILFSFWIASRWLDHRPLREFGFHFNRDWWVDLDFGLFLGAILMVFIFAVELSAGWITITRTLQTSDPGRNFWAEIASYVVLFLSVGIAEEMLSRGYQLRNMAEGFNLKQVGPRAALLIGYLVSSSMFGLFHLANPNTSWISTVNLIVAGLFLGLGYVLTGELAIPIGIHITWNFFQGNVFGFPVSGGAPSASFIGIQQGGPDLWTGGAFGPEAGLIGIAAIAIGSLLIFLWVRWRYGEASLKESLAIYQPEGAAGISANANADAAAPSMP